MADKKIPQHLPPLELHVCMGLNSCENKGYSGDNKCAGQGDCSTITHACHTLNDCKDQGGCGLFGSEEEFCYPGENNCKFQGSCGAPILASRFIVAGPNKGTSVWLLARKRFEERMDKEGKKYGKVPEKSLKYGPTPEYAGQRISGYESCGQSGNRFCSFSFKDIEDKTDADKVARRTKFAKQSQKNMDETLENCNKINPKDCGCE